eukprot:TRINITY_DN1887_c0_g1_i1.p1 TRINITY_DN1887_c0_g1~~TRINITY_DN1887_c0_g1_i1.p1  ORF type:complete len:285 (-),score=35.13 TRINITY_DN1887_c0_g1_i1:539-1393(-)
MMCAHNVVIKNTFINVFEDDSSDDETCSTRTRPRLFSEPLPKLSSKVIAMQNADSGLESRKTSAGDSEDEVSSQQELSSNATPVHSPRQVLLLCPLYTSLGAVGGLLSHPTFVETVAPKHMDIPMEWQGKTSVMVRNISYKCSRIMFCEALNRAGYKNLFDYVYVPMNVVRSTSKGYAFVNFVDDRTAYKFKNRFHGRKMDVPGSFKLLEIIPANLQGYSKNSTHYIAKQCELSSVPKMYPERMSNDVDEGSFMDTRSTSSSCHDCQRKVLPQAQFCHWCGAGL